MANELADRMARSRTDCSELEALAKKVLDSEKRRVQNAQGILSLYKRNDASESAIDNDSETDSETDSDVESSIDSESTSHVETDTDGHSSHDDRTSASESESMTGGSVLSGRGVIRTRVRGPTHHELQQENIRLKVELEQLQHMDCQVFAMTRQYETAISNIKNTMSTFDKDFNTSLEWIVQKYQTKIAQQVSANEALAVQHQNLVSGLLHIRESLVDAKDGLNYSAQRLGLETVEEQLGLNMVD